MQQSISITPAEFNGRTQALLATVQKQKWRGVVLFAATNILYFTGFAFAPTERPIAFVLNADGEKGMFVPRLEVEHVNATTAVDRVEHYLEYPGNPRPMTQFKTMLDEMGMIQKPHLPPAVQKDEEMQEWLQKATNMPDYLVEEQQRPLHNLMPYWKHHTGHAIGLRYHEGPYLDTGDDTIMQPGMVFTVEPGLYAPELGGFRHSDTVAITADDIEMMTYYPRDWQNLVIE